MNLTVATANVLHAKAPWRPLADVVGWQEADKHPWWEKVPTGRRFKPARKAAHAVGITWAEGWNKIAADCELAMHGLAGVAPHRYVAWVVLEKDGVRVKVINTHATKPRGVIPAPKHRAESWGHTQAIVAREVASGLADGLHVVVTGDFNRHRPQVQFNGVRHVAPDWRMKRGKKVPAIDHILASEGLHLDGQAIHLRKGNSDHEPVRVRLTTTPPPKPKPSPEVTLNKLPANLPALLRAEGLDVKVLEGWQERGRPASTGSFNPVGVLWHHTGSPDVHGDLADDMRYAKWLATVGRSDLPAPLCQLSISAEGTVYVLAAGRANHAGKAKASGSVAAGDGNRLYVGVECMNSGKQGWSAAQYGAMVKTGAVLAKVLGTSVRAQRAHRETSVTGKWDPGMLDMDKFRADIEAELADEDTPLPPPRIRAARRIQTAAEQATHAGVIERQWMLAAAQLLREGEVVIPKEKS